MSDIESKIKTIRWTHSRIEKLCEVAKTSDDKAVKSLGELIDALNDEAHFALIDMEREFKC